MRRGWAITRLTSLGYTVYYRGHDAWTKEPSQAHLWAYKRDAQSIAKGIASDLPLYLSLGTKIIKMEER